jgi:hypothetical protein
VSPRHLRAKAGVSLEEMASALRTSKLSLRVLEHTPLEGWTLRTLGAYVQACGCRLRLVAVRNRDGREEVLQ